MNEMTFEYFYLLLLGLFNKSTNFLRLGICYASVFKKSIASTFHFTYLFYGGQNDVIGLFIK